MNNTNIVPPVKKPRKPRTKKADMVKKKLEMELSTGWLVERKMTELQN